MAGRRATERSPRRPKRNQTTLQRITGTTAEKFAQRVTQRARKQRTSPRRGEKEDPIAHGTGERNAKPNRAIGMGIGLTGGAARRGELRRISCGGGSGRPEWGLGTGNWGFSARRREIDLGIPLATLCCVCAYFLRRKRNGHPLSGRALSLFSLFFPSPSQRLMGSGERAVEKRLSSACRGENYNGATPACRHQSCITISTTSPFQSSKIKDTVAR